jgi:hypothetical protein
VSKQYFEVTRQLVSSKALAKIWSRAVAVSKDKKSKAKKSARQTGGGTSEAEPIDAESERILAVSQAETEFNTHGENVCA